jgi:hypothetical protein
MPEYALGNALPGEGGKTFRPPNLTPIEQARYAQYVEMQIEANEKGWLPATVVNLLPMTLNPSSVLLNGLRISGVPLNEERWAASPKLKLQGGLEIPYVTHVIMTPSFNVLEQVTGTDLQSFQGSIKNKTWWPIDLAKDIIYGSDLNQERGGTFCYKGAHLPMSVFEREAGMSTVEQEREMFESAYTRMIRFLTQRFDFASGAFASKSAIDVKNVRENERNATRYLRKVGVLEVDPEWLTRVLTTQDRAPVKCPQCDAACSRYAKKCTAPGCGYFLKPYEAFMEGMFDLETPGAITSLRRCTKHQLQRLGIYPKVKPLDEYLRETLGDEDERTVDEGKGSLGRGSGKKPS